MADSSLYKPDARFWHASQCVGDRVYVWGGHTKGCRQEKLSFFEEFDSNKRSWRTHTEIEAKDAHPAMSQVACASFSDFLYLFGGNDGEKFNNTLSVMDLKMKKWKRLSQSENSSISPMKKDACGMAHFTTQSGEHILIVMCGYAEKSHSTDTKSTFSPNKNSKNGVTGWTNEIHMFDIAKYAWSVPEITGTRPEPCADVSFTSIDKQRGIFYGGREQICLYLFDINSMNIEKCESRSRSPPKRLGHHAAGCIGFNSGKPCLLMSGGRQDHSKDSEPLSDIWMFDPQSREWKEEHIPNHAKVARWGHTIAVIMHSYFLVEVLMFGGSAVPFDAQNLDNIPRLAQPVSLIYGYHNNEWALIGAVDKSESWQFGKRVRELTQLQAESATITDSDDQYLQGVEVLRKTTVTITNSGCKFDWEGYGLKLHVPENSLPSAMKQLSLTIVASNAGHYRLPENSTLMSGVYWFCYKPLNFKLQLKKPVKLEIQHCAKPENTSNLSFARASSNQDKLPYTFKCLKGGDFISCESYGILKEDSFCGITLVGPPEAKQYQASLFYLRHDMVYRDIRFVVTMDIELHFTALKLKFSKEPDTEAKIDFESDAVTLKIPPDGTFEGWDLYASTYPMVTKMMVDSFKPGRSIPHCQILVALIDPGRARSVHHRIKLQGAKAPRDYIEITLAPEGPGTNTPSTGREFIEVDSSLILGNKDHFDVCQSLKYLSRQFLIKVGEALGLFYPTLAKMNNLQAEMVDAWLKRQDNVLQQSGEPTWRGLADALEKIGQTGIADDIRKTKINVMIAAQQEGGGET